jgi:hypothetical protein
MNLNIYGGVDGTEGHKNRHAQSLSTAGYVRLLVQSIVINTDIPSL